MTAGLRYQLSVALRARAPLFPLIATAFVVIGVFADGYNLVGDTWGLTGIFAAGLACWLTLAILTSEPPTQAEMATVARGGHLPRLGAQLLLVAVEAAALAITFVAYPMLLDHIVSRPVFIRRVEGGDVLAALATNFTGAALGGAIGLLCAPPRIRRPPVSAGTALGLLLTMIPVSVALGDFGGPVAAARAMTRARAGHVPLDEPAAWLSTLALAAIVVAVCRRRTVRGASPALLT